MKTLEEGDKAPAFKLDSADGPVSLADFAGKTVVVYFYPKDLTPGCTTEAIDFHKAKAKLAKKGAAVVGISRDSVTLHEKFAAKCDLGFPLLSDPEGKVTKAWGAWGEKTLYGKKSEGVIRSTFVVGPDGKIKKAFRNVKVAGHIDKVLEAIESE